MKGKEVVECFKGTREVNEKHLFPSEKEEAEVDYNASSYVCFSQRARRGQMGAIITKMHRAIRG